MKNGWQVALRAAIASVLATFIAQRLDLRFPIYAMIAAVIVTDATSHQTRRYGLERLVGTSIGAASGALLSQLLPHNLAMLGVSVALTMLLCFAAGLRDAAKVAGYVSAVVMLSYGDRPWGYAAYRFMETSIGILCAIAVSFLWDLGRRVPRSSFFFEKNSRRSAGAPAGRS